jgi:hypothetical protein
LLDPPSSTFFNDLLRFRTDTSTWEVLSEKLPFEPRAHHTAVLVRRPAAGGPHLALRTL